MKPILTVFVLFFHFSMLSQTEYKVIADSLFQLSVPDYMEEYPNLIDGPGLQMISKGKGHLLMTVITDEKTKINALDSGFSSQQYYDYVARRVAEKMSSPKIYPAYTDTLKNLSFIQGQVRGELQGERAIYTIRVIETPNYYFQIVVWMEERHETDSEVRNDLQHILDSFELVH